MGKYEEVVAKLDDMYKYLIGAEATSQSAIVELAKAYAITFAAHSLSLSLKDTFKPLKQKQPEVEQDNKQL